MVSNSSFPNYMQMRQRIPLPVWHAVRIISVGFALGLCITLIIRPALGLFLFWGVLIPFVPLLFFLAPGLWRNICPMAALNQTPRLFEFNRELTVPSWFREYGYVIAISLFLVIVSSRKVIFNSNGIALAILVLLLLAGAFVMGNFFKGKSGWCSSICPLLPVQRIYGQTPFVTIPNSHCQPCVGCTKNCYDFNPKVAYLADMNDTDPYFSGYRRFFVGLFPGFILGYYTVPNPPEISSLQMAAQLAMFALISLGIFTLVSSFAKASAQKIAVIFGAMALNLYYWFNAPVIADLVWPSGSAEVMWFLRATVLLLTIVWIYRTYQKEGLFRLELERAAQSAHSVVAESIVSHRAALATKPEVIIDGKRIVVAGNRTILELAEANGLDIEAGCRMGVCGADPVCIVSGMENLSKVGSDEKSTLERLGLADNTRMACVTRVKGKAEVSLKPEQPKQYVTSVVEGFSYNKSVRRVVIIGNGIAGVTAADHVRRRHPTCEIHLIGRERHHLYNRMGITRLIYGRSAMQGLYLLPDKWYDDFQITCWLNTNVTGVDVANQSVELGTGESLEYDRLIMTTGSRSFVPPIDGFNVDGCFVLREAEDAMAIRAFVQERVCRHAVVAGGGLLGLEAAYGLHKLGLEVSVLERSTALLRRQLDPRGSQVLRTYLEGLGISIVVEAETVSVHGENRAHQITLKDGRVLPCDLLLVAAGIRSELELAQSSGLETGRGIVVDEAMRTSHPTIFAAGDVAEFRGSVLGLWPVAVAQAEVAAANAVATDEDEVERYREIVPVTMLKVVGVDLTSIGRFNAGEDEREYVQDDADNHRYRKLVVRHENGQVVAVGAILIGYPEDAQTVAEVIKSGTHIGTAIDEIEKGDWTRLAELVE